MKLLKSTVKTLPRTGSQRGAALLVVMFCLLMAGALGMALTYSGIYEVKLSRNYKTSSEAFYLAEAGVNHAIKLIQANNLDFTTLLKGADGVLGTADDGILAGSHVPAEQQIPASGFTLGNGNYRVVATDGSGGAATKLVITATATGANNSTATVEAILGAPGTSVHADTPNIPCAGVNVDAAAINYLGDLNKKAKLDFHPKQKHGDEHGDLDSGSPLLIAVNGNGRPGVVIEDKTAYKKITDDIAKRIASHKIPAGAITGSPMVTIGSGSHTAEASFKQTENPVLSSDAMLEIGDNFATVVAGDLTPAANNLVSGGDISINAAHTWGTQQAPQITYLTANKVTLTSTINGYGTLIVAGDLRLDSHAVFNFTGNIYVMGGTDKDAIFQNNKGSMTVNGNIVVLGTNAARKKSIFKLEDDHDDNSAVTVINGSVFVLTGNNTDKEEKAEFRAKNGNVTINGLVSLVGDKLKFEANMKDEASFTVNGAVALAVPGTDGKYKAKVHLHGDQILIDYNQQNVNAALLKMSGMKTSANNPILPPLTLPTASKISWREIRN